MCHARGSPPRGALRPDVTTAPDTLNMRAQMTATQLIIQRERQCFLGLPVSLLQLEPLMTAAREQRARHTGQNIYLRGVVEYSNICYRNCMYCGMGAANRSLNRYRLSSDTIRSAAAIAQSHGIGTLMIQGADDLRYDVSQLAQAVEAATSKHNVRVLLCIGERPIEDYRRLAAAGASQAIVKFETSNSTLYKAMRPHNTLRDRLKLIDDLQPLGFNISTGFIYGLPGVTAKDTENDIALCGRGDYFAVSVSPFIPSSASPLADARMADLPGVLHCIASLRLRFPTRLIPAVSALNLVAEAHGYPDNTGQFLGLQAGANLLTVNLTPESERSNYVIYDLDRAIVTLSSARRLAEESRLSIC